MQAGMTEPLRTRAASIEELKGIFERMADPDLIQASIDGYEPRPTDVVITPYGKSGTTWTQQIVHTLRTSGDMDFDDISRVVPWIETCGVLNIDVNAAQSAVPRAFKSHLAYDKMPKGARYINIIRSPVDAAFSAFKFMEGWFLEPGMVPADEFVAMTMKDAGYQKHFISWWPHREDDDVLYLVFEHMKEDLERTIEKIAAFIGIALDDELRAITLDHASLPFMLRHKDRFDDAMMRRNSEETVLPAGSDSAKVRVGQVRQHALTDETVRAINQLWRDIVTPVTGFDTYEALINSLA
jgi:hypothetical protein